MDVRVLQAEGPTDAAEALRVSADRPAQPAVRAAAGGAGGVGAAGAAVAVERLPTGVVVLTGRLDATTVGDVRARLHELAHHGSGDLVLDVSGTEVGNATGLGMFVGLHRAAERCERHLVLQGVPPRLMRMLRATKLHRILRVASSTLIAPEIAGVDGVSGVSGVAGIRGAAGVSALNAVNAVNAVSGVSGVSEDTQADVAIAVSAAC